MFVSLSRLCAATAIALALALSGGLASAVSAQPEIEPDSPAVPQSPRRPDLLRDLDLTPEQLQTITEVRQRYEPDMRNLHEELRREQQTLHTMLAGSDSTEAIRGQFDRVQTLRKGLGQLHFDSLLGMREVLTPDQRSDLANRMRERHDRFRQRRRRHHPFRNEAFRNGALRDEAVGGQPLGSI